MNGIKKIFFWFTLLFMVIPLVATAQSATAILDKCAAAYEKANGLTASFAIHVRGGVSGGAESMEGTIQMKGERFTLFLPDMRTWFDGETQWTYVMRNQEVNVSTPSGDELRTVNPMLLLRDYQKGFNARLRGESTAPSGKAAYEVELTPKRKADIRWVRLQIEKNTGYPASIAMEDKNGTSITIRISGLKVGVNQPDDVFIFNEADYPDAEVIDLR